MALCFVLTMAPHRRRLPPTRRRIRAPGAPAVLRAPRVSARRHPARLQPACSEAPAPRAHPQPPSSLSGQEPPSAQPPPAAPPPPGREDEFADSNGESLQQQRGEARLATLERDISVDTVLQELSAIQQDGPRNVAILGTRHTSYLHQQIIELLTYANVLVGNHVFTSGAGGTNAAVIRGALRAERPDLLTVVLPQSLQKQPKETQEQVSGNLAQLSLRHALRRSTYFFPLTSLRQEKERPSVAQLRRCGMHSDTRPYLPLRPPPPPALHSCSRCRTW